ncbi:unnamed protein product [Zymoseptoria tritici ST99CH_3D7]|uniref:Uncharacterized protein n=1 Tax=Zymoseptoria tritici (strain ST99CH_3D7) TaxID=1276538 RepID=A0A1X7S9T9_ZYMT9|nr:unnamed protein product [Zymoseptoria tritici ST99CH_3D7]
MSAGDAIEHERDIAKVITKEDQWWRVAWKPTRESLEHLRHNTGSYWKKRLQELVDQNAQHLTQEEHTVVPDAALKKPTAVHKEQDTVAPIATALASANAADNMPRFRETKQHHDDEQFSVAGQSADKQSKVDTKRKRSKESAEDSAKALQVSGSEEENDEPVSAKRHRRMHTNGKLTSTKKSTTVKTPKSTMRTTTLNDDIQERSITPTKAAPARPPRKKIGKVLIPLPA